MTTATIANPASNKVRRSTTTHHRPALRLVPPIVEAEPVQLAFEFEYELPSGLPAVPTAPRHLHLVAGGTSTPDQLKAEHDRIMGMPEGGKWVARIARAILEVSAGLRPAGQLTRYVARDELARLSSRGTAVRRHPSARGRDDVAQLRAVRSLRLCPISDTVIEASAVLVGAERARAIALRLERQAGNWVVTDVALP